MYKKKNKTRLKKASLYYTIKRKLILIISACMLGMSNAMYDEDKMIDANQNYTEQEQRKD